MRGQGIRFAGRSDNEIMALYLAGLVRSNAFDAGIQTGMYVTDSGSMKLSTIFELELKPILESAGIKVVFCGLNEVSGAEAAALVEEAVAVIGPHPSERGARGRV